MKKDRKKILVIATHPDDEILGCGGIIQRHIVCGDYVVICIVTSGSDAEYPGGKKRSSEKDKELAVATRILGVNKVVQLNFPDMKLDAVPHNELNQKIEDTVRKFQPSIIYTHSVDDVNQDHVAIAKSTYVVCRPGKPYLKKVFAYEVLSSSEWPTQTPFQPNTFINISAFLKKKIASLLAYKSEVRLYPHPRSPKGVEILAQYRGLQSGMKAAEAFKLILNYEK